MAKFVSVLGIVILVVLFLSLFWPRISPYPRPQALQRIHDIVMQTQPGQQAANVLGVSDDQQVIPFTPQAVSQSLVNGVKARVTDVVITQTVRQIMSRFSKLPVDQQERILNAISESMNQGTPSGIVK